VAADLALVEAWLVDPVLGAAQHLVLKQVGAIFDRVVPGGGKFHIRRTPFIDRGSSVTR
jgi:hypothetical protein